MEKKPKIKLSKWYIIQLNIYLTRKRNFGLGLEIEDRNKANLTK